MLSDLRSALRLLTHVPGFTFTAILVLALGIGANTAVFAIVRAVLLRPLPYAEPDRLVFLWRESSVGARHHGVLTGLWVAEFGARTPSLSSFAVLKTWQGGLPDASMDLFRPDGAERLRGAFATPNFFELLGVRAAVGRTFTRSDEAGEPVAVLSDGLWRRRFAADPAIVGQRVALVSGLPRTVTTCTIVGVLPPGFRFTYPDETELWAVLPWSTINRSAALLYHMVGRLKPGMPMQQAQAEATAALRDLERANQQPGGRPSPTHIVVETLPDHLASDVRPGVLLLAGVAGLVLVIACVNLGLLVIARTVDRRRELAVRSSLGAPPWRLVRELLAEGLVLGALGGTAGVALAYLSLPALRSLLPPMLPRGDEAVIDVQVLAFSVAVTIGTGLVCGLAPAWMALRSDLQSALRRAGGTVTGDRRVTRSRRLVVAIQVAVVLLLLVGSGLLLHSFWRLQHVDLGFDGTGVTMAEVQVFNPKYFAVSKIVQFERDVVQRLRTLPGVHQATVTTAVPIYSHDTRTMVGGGAAMRAVDPEYFDVLRIALTDGRLLDERDTATSPPVAVVSESLARRLFNSESPLGRKLDVRPPRTIVGVVRDVRFAGVAKSAEPAFYVPRAQWPTNSATFLLKTTMPAGSLAPAIRRIVREVDPEQPIERIATIDSIVAGNTAEQRFYAVATGAFAGTALLLAVCGLFGVVARTVAERRREIAIRMALGADARRLLRLVIGFGLAPVVAGIVAGLTMAVAASRLMRRFLFEVAPTDPATYGGAALVVLGVAAAACYLPARRALGVEPMAALKSE
jgi:predicted permease